MRERVFRYVKEKYGAAPDYPFPTAPLFPVLRHEDNRKLFAFFMEIQREKLGLEGAGRVDVINVKAADSLLADILSRQPGYFRGFSVTRGNWISILLDGTVPFEDICARIDESYAVTASKQKRQKMRQLKEWIIPANPKYYDIEHAFDSAREIRWKQGSGIRTGDTVYMYVAAPVSAILFQCRVTETDIPCQYRGSGPRIAALMKIRLQKRYKPACFPLEKLKGMYGVFAVRGPRGVPHSLSEALKKQGGR